ncbi:hypothetical protein RHGRI_034112 [Rhododendron griersonianum]|uniref:Uncharacterized protein n=1 Tax=Rhododendron griersonianum TaxID=479676 RepID=A0AAV6I536_9ERIC|nr:hypothetical protein RHGRI_034112 [Rhododendron griersonianum]
MEVVFDHSAGDALCSETMCSVASPTLFRSPMPREKEVLEAMSPLWRRRSGFLIILPNIIIGKCISFVCWQNCFFSIDAPRGFLFEWWSVFWDIFIARTNEKHSEAASTYIETQQMKAPEHKQQLQMQQQLQLIQQ